MFYPYILFNYFFNYYIYIPIHVPSLCWSATSHVPVSHPHMSGTLTYSYALYTTILFMIVVYSTAPIYAYHTATTTYPSPSYPTTYHTPALAYSATTSCCRIIALDCCTIACVITCWCCTVCGWLCAYFIVYGWYVSTIWYVAGVGCACVHAPWWCVGTPWFVVSVYGLNVGRCWWWCPAYPWSPLSSPLWLCPCSCTHYFIVVFSWGHAIASIDHTCTPPLFCYCFWRWCGCWCCLFFRTVRTRRWFAFSYSDFPPIVYSTPIVCWVSCWFVTGTFPCRHGVVVADVGRCVIIWFWWFAIVNVFCCCIGHYWYWLDPKYCSMPP